ncbi:MAG: sugar ABC transporter substrate-binding protein [Chloroflexota bacterium]|nr:MAG: sugar ABC transporter substrate-binding protein [Chloroflexota bacterium]
MKQKLWFLAVILALLALLVACGQAAAPTPAQEEAAPAEEAKPAEAAAPATEQPAEAAPATEEAAVEPAEAEEPAAGSGEVVELRWLQWWVNEWGPDNHAKLIADFEAQHPNIKVTVVDVPWPDMAGKLQAAAAGGESYDLFGVEGEWVAGLDKQGFVETLDPWLEKEPDFAAKLTATTPMRLQGQTKALCLYLIPYQFAYNVGLFAEKGYEPPTNWDEFTALMEQIHADDPNSYGMSMPLQDAGFIMTRYFGFRLAQEGGQWFDQEGKVAFNSPEGVAAMQWWKDFYDKGLVVPGSLGEDQAQMLEYVASGQVPSVIDGPFIWTKAKQIDPEIKIAYAPAWKDKTGGYSWACSGVGISANSPNKEAAWEFVKYLYSDEVSVDMTQKVSLLWGTNAAVESLKGSDDPLLANVPDFANQDPEHNVLFPVLPEAEKLVDSFGLAFQEVIGDKKDAKTALDEAAATWQETLDSAGQ